MTFLSPLFLLGAAAAAIPIVLHFLHREPEARVKFAAVHLLRHAPVEDTRRRRIREWLLLALRVSALVLLALAFARPFLLSGSAGSAAGVTVVAIDTSLSMSPLMGRAHQLADDAIAKVPAGDLVGIVTFADTAKSAAAPSTDRALARAAVDAAAAGFGATRYAAAMSAAAHMIESVGAQSSTIVVVTDLQSSGWDGGDRVAVPESTRVLVADVGARPANFAVTALRADLDHVVATIRNSGAASRDAHVRLAVDGRDISDAVASVAAGGTADVVLAGARGVVAQATVDDPSGIQGDNTRYLVLDNASRAAVPIITTNGDLARDAFYVQQAVLAAGAGAGFDAKGIAAADFGASSAAKMAESACVVLTSTNGLDARGRALLSDYVRAGGGLFIAAGPEVSGDVAAEILGGSVSMVAAAQSRPPADSTFRFAPADLRHPVFRAFENQAATLSLVSFRQAVSLAGKTCSRLANFTTGDAALLDCQAGEGRVLIFASDIDNRWNDFPLHPSFVPFVQESLGYLAGTHEHGTELLVGDVPAGVQPRPGVVTIPEAAAVPSSRRVAVNVDPGESDPDRLSPEEFQGAIARLKDAGRAEVQLQASQQENRQHLWEYALLAAIAFLLAESVVSMRAA